MSGPTREGLLRNGLRVEILSFSSIAGNPYPLNQTTMAALVLIGSGFVEQGLGPAGAPAEQLASAALRNR